VNIELAFIIIEMFCGSLHVHCIRLWLCPFGS